MTLRPAAWGCEVDVHFRFPGAGSSDAFGALQASADEFCFAGVHAAVPSVPTHAVINALHLVRPEPHGTRSTGAYSAAVRGLSAAGETAIAAATVLGALDVLREELTEAFPAATLPAWGGGVPADWERRAHAANSADFHLAVVKSLPWYQRPREIWHILWPSDEIVVSSALRAGAVPSPGLRGRLGRLVRGVRQIRGR